MVSVQKISFTSGDLLKNMIEKTPTVETAPKNDTETKHNFNRNLYIAYASSAAILGISLIALRNSRNLKNAFFETRKGLSVKLEDLGGVMLKKIENATRKADEAISINNGTVENLNQKAKWFDNYLASLDNKIKNIEACRVYTGERNLGYIDNLRLLQNLDNDGKRIILPDETVKWIQNAADCFIKGDDKIKPRKLTPDSTIWALTAESVPEKEGGLGEVPVQIAKNMTKELDINNYIVRPMTFIPGKAKLEQVNGQYTYYYNLNEPKIFSMPVEKVAEFNTNVFRSDRYETVPVEVFTGIDPRFGFKRIMFKQNDFFTSPGLYKDTQKVSEKERYAFFSKAVYEFMKLVSDSNSIPNSKLYKKFYEIKAPDAMIVNDWHPAAISALLRYKSVAEAAEKEISPEIAESFRTMNLLNINHNLDYQGEDWVHSSEILNTLFDKYAYDIYENANTNFNIFGLNNVLTIDGKVNLANMSACLANKMAPVSPNYADELAEQAERSRALQHVCEIRKANKTLKGRSNGWDRNVNEVSVNNINQFNDKINGDKFTVFKQTLKRIEGLTDIDRTEMHKILNSGIDFKSFRIRVEELKKIGSKAINQALDDMEKNGILNLRELKAYTNTDKIENIMLARKHNKIQFMDYINSMLQNSKVKKKDNYFNFAQTQITDLSDIKPEDLDDTIVFNMGVRFVTQKGVDIACNAIENVMKNWNEKYPGKKQPIFIIGGKDDEGGNIKNFVILLKNKLGLNGKQIVYQDGYTANNIFQAGTDFTLYSSHFEPDGSKWESLYKGTPVICTRVGGHVNSVTDGVNGFLTARKIPEIKASGKDYLTEISDDFANAIYKAADTFYDKKNDAYAKMVRASIDGNQSWIIKDDNGKIVDGALLGNLKDLGFDLNDFSQIKH